MKRIPLAILVTACLTATGPQPARAELCTIDAVPAATLLLPYFEVDLSKLPRFKKVEQTIISIQNASNLPSIAHVVLWTDLSVPTLAFDVFLTGFDVEEINLTELFYTGEIKGLQVDAPGPGFVLGDTPSGGLQTRGELIRAHRGESVNGQCYGRPVNSNVARGYVTIDNVSQTSILFPNESGYFGSGGVASDFNSLWGVVLLKLNKRISADLLVHVEAGSASDGDYTFYGRYVGFDGSDGREPLATSWAVRYFSGQERTDVIAWRDSAIDQGPFTCSELGQAGWYPMGEVQIVAFDENEEPIQLVSDPGPFPAETQMVQVLGPALDARPFKSGWIFLNLNEDGIRQSFVWVRQGLRKRAALYPGMPFYQDTGGADPSSACGTAPQVTATPIP